MKIAVMGAPGTGKTTLVEVLRLALGADASFAGSTVTEYGSPQQLGDCDLTLLMGLDLPQQGNAATPTPTPTPLQSDAHLRQWLDNRAMPYAVVYGSGQARTDCALQAIRYHHQRAAAMRLPQTASAWHWNCETCSDAECEHRLFSALLKTNASVRP